MVFGFSKAFDVVPHHILVQKLIDNGDKSSAFLKRCTQQVILNGVKSQPVKVSSGVPQGSVIGPAFFTLFETTLQHALNQCAIRLFADDTLLYTMVHSDTDVANMQCTLEKMQWIFKNLFDSDSPTLPPPAGSRDSTRQNKNGCCSLFTGSLI